MKLLLLTWASDEYFDEVVAGYVEITSEVARTILSRAKAFKNFDEQDQKARPKQGRLLSALFWDNNVVHFLPKAGVTQEELENLEGREFIQAERDVDYLAKEVQVENILMHISGSTVYWTCTIKYTGIEVSTEVIPFNEIEKAL